MTRNRRMIVRGLSLIVVTGNLCAWTILGMKEVLLAIRQIPSVSVQYEFIKIILIYIGMPAVIILSQIVHTLLIRVWETWLAFLEPSQIDLVIPALKQEKEYKVAKEAQERERESKKAEAYIAKKAANIAENMKRFEGNGKRQAKAAAK